eukprot:scaffold128_cov343-Prasinococcus_capsulatus_cf.AAC.1
MTAAVTLTARVQVLADETCTSNCACASAYPTCDNPAYVGSTYSAGASSGDTTDLWTPPQHARGLVARALMYVHV